MPKRLTIGFDAKRLFHNNTGLGNYSRNLVKQLKIRYPEHEYHLFTPSIKENDSTTYFLENDFVIHTSPAWQPSVFWRQIGCSQVVNALSLDIFHGLSHELPFGIHSKTKTIVTIHDLIYEKYPQLFGWFDARLYQWKYRSSCQRADAIFAVSESTSKDLGELYGLAEEKRFVTHQSCNENFQTQPQRQRERSYFLYVGTVNARKSLLHVIKAMAKLDDRQKRKLIVVGNGGSYLQEVRSAVDQWQLGPWVEFMGNVNNEQLAEIYDGALALLLPSQYEGFGIPIIEALFRQTPAITCNNSSLPEAGGPGALYFDYGDIDQLASAMVNIQEERLWRSLSEVGYDYVMKNFSTGITTQQVMEGYGSVLGKS